MKTARENAKRFNFSYLYYIFEYIQGASKNPDKFQFKFSAILCLRQRLLLASEKA